VDLHKEPFLLAEFARTWQDSLSDKPSDRHEEGGFALHNTDGSVSVERWPRGERFRITPPPLDDDNCYNGKVVIAAFHTHPNPPVDELGRQWQQEPSVADRRWHGRRKLPGFVISRDFVFAIDANGSFRIIGKRDEVLVP
jgi:hypothetical protein